MEAFGCLFQDHSPMGLGMEHRWTPVVHKWADVERMAIQCFSAILGSVGRSAGNSSTYSASRKLPSCPLFIHSHFWILFFFSVHWCFPCMRVWGTLELELETVVNCHVSAGN